MDYELAMAGKGVKGETALNNARRVRLTSLMTDPHEGGKFRDPADLFKKAG